MEKVDIVGLGGKIVIAHHTWWSIIQKVDKAQQRGKKEIVEQHG